MNTLLITLVLLSLISDTTSALNNFRSGHIHVDIVSNNLTTAQAQVTVVSAWSLASSPCGPSCNFQDIGMSTNNVRRDITVRSHDPNTFGKYLFAWNKQQTAVSNDITKTANTEGVGEVFAVDKEADWVQEIFTFNKSLDLTNDRYNFSMEGLSWPNISQQCDDGTGECGYHIQSSVVLGTRNDTGVYNRSPYVSYRPVYQLPIDTVTQVGVFVADPDNDFIYCRWAEGEELHGMEIPVGVDLSPECILTVNTSSLNGLNNLDFIGIPIVVEELVVSPFSLDNGRNFIERETLSITQVSFLIQVLDFMSNPQFVPGFFSPCNSNDLKNEALYATHVENKQSSFLFLPVMAQPANGSDSEIARFLMTSRPSLTSHLLPPHDVPAQNGQKVRMTDLTVTYSSSDVGDHFFQLVAMDTKDRLTQTCTLRVDIRLVNYTPISSSDFIGTPGPDDVICPLNSQCDFPVFIKNDPSSGDAVLTVSSHDPVALPEVTINSAVKTSFHGNNVTRYQIYVTGTQPGYKDICFQLKFPTRESNQCVQIYVFAPDPCIKLDHPCTDPSRGTCQTNVTNPTTSFCECAAGYAGDHCEMTVDPCTQGYCGSNSIACHYNVSLSNIPTCDCAANYTGSRCEHALHCLQNPCQPHGDCVPTSTSFICECHKGFSGPLCEQVIGSLQISSGLPAVIPGLTEELTLNCTFTQSPLTTLVWLSIFYNNDTDPESFTEMSTITLNSPAVVTTKMKELGNITVSGKITQGETSFLLVKLRDPNFQSGRYFRCDAEDVDAHGPLIRSSTPVLVNSQQTNTELLLSEIKALRLTRDALIKQCQP